MSRDEHIDNIDSPDEEPRNAMTPLLRRLVEATDEQVMTCGGCGERCDERSRARGPHFYMPPGACCLACDGVPFLLCWMCWSDWNDPEARPALDARIALRFGPATGGRQ